MFESVVFVLLLVSLLVKVDPVMVMLRVLLLVKLNVFIEDVSLVELEMVLLVVLVEAVVVVGEVL